MTIYFPYQYDGRKKTREVDNDEYIKGLIEQLLFTSPGERVMRPDFGSGLNQLVFAPNSPELAASTQVLVQGALQQWLGDLIVVQSVDIQVFDAVLTIEVNYVVRHTQQQQQDIFSYGEGQ